MVPSLFFDDPNTSTAYTSTLRLTNVLDDVDATALPPGMDGELERDPSNLASAVQSSPVRATVTSTPRLTPLASATTIGAAARCT